MVVVAQPRVELPAEVDERAGGEREAAVGGAHPAVETERADLLMKAVDRAEGSYRGD